MSLHDSYFLDSSERFLLVFGYDEHAYFCSRLWDLLHDVNYQEIHPNAQMYELPNSIHSTSKWLDRTVNCKDDTPLRKVICSGTILYFVEMWETTVLPERKTNNR